MNLPRGQLTLARPCRLTGFGYWSGSDVAVEFRPAPENAGIVFVRCDLPGSPRVPAVIENRIETPRRTNLAFQGARVEMVEHVLAALTGLGIDNCEVWANQPEMPACDGSCEPFVCALLEAGTVELTAPKRWMRIDRLIRVDAGDAWAEARPASKGTFRVKYELEYDTCAAIGRQFAEFSAPHDSFVNDIAPSRTFVTKPEAEMLQRQGFGDRVTHKHLLIFDHDGPIGNSLRFPNECARHKVLDLIGDLALASTNIEGEFMAHRAGHYLHAELVRKWKETCARDSQWRQSA